LGGSHTPVRALFHRYFFFQFMLIYSINLTKHSHTLAHADGKSFGTQKDCNSCVKKSELGSRRGAEGVVVFGKQIFSDKWKSDVICMPGDRDLDWDRGTVAHPKCQMLVSIAT